MSRDTTESILDMVDARPSVDNREVFDALWAIVGELRAKLDARFELEPDPSVADLQPYPAPDGAPGGFLSAFSGPEIDWLVQSWVGTPGTSFSNMHLTVYLGPQVRVPHFGFALGTTPDIFVFMDYTPRSDLALDLASLDRYYEAANESFLKMRRDERFSPFVSQSLYMRQAQSQTSHCYIVPASEDTLAVIRELAHEMLDRWLAWVDEAEPVPPGERAALAARDLSMRRTICERDPANALGVRIFGQAFTDRLVRALWGADRQLPRPSSQGEASGA